MKRVSRANLSLCGLSLTTALTILFASATDSGAQQSSGWQSGQNLDDHPVLKRWLEKRRARGSKPTVLRPAAKSGTTAADCRQFLDLAYGPAPLQKLDVFSPKSGTNLPVVFFVHGGGWKRGDKKMHQSKAFSYVARDMVFISTNYRMAPKVKHPVIIEDVAEAFAWTRQHIAEYGGNPDCIYIMGHSAGAHLVDLLATNDRFLKQKGLTLANIKGVISLDTASLNLLEMKKADTFEGQFVGDLIENAFGSDPKVLTDGSPTLNLQKGKNYPPFLIYCGEKRKSGVSEQKSFVKALEEAGGKADLKIVPLNHAEINLQASVPGSSEFPQIMDFINQTKNVSR